MKRFGLLLLGFLLMPLASHAQTAREAEYPPPAEPAWNPTEVDIALNYAKQSQFHLAFPIFSRLAEAGNVEAQYHLDLPPLKWSSLRYGFDHGG